MAKCEKREIKQEPPPVEFVLTLSLDEARGVCLALGEFGGSGDIIGSAFDQLYAALGGNSEYLRHFKVVHERGKAPSIVRVER